MSNINQKPERIASALYLVTGFFSDQEPVKWKLRALAGDLVSISVSLISQMFKEREAARLELRSIVLEISGLSRIARNAGIISEPNYDILNQELLKYLENLGFPAGLKEENGFPVLSQAYFGIAEKETKSLSEANPEQVKDKIKEEPTGAPETLLPARKPDFSQGQKLDERALAGIHRNPSQTDNREVLHKEKPLREFGAVSVKKNSRQSVIIALLKRKKEIMIKDVSPLISGCSEKTIQRELSAMVQAGILRKIGEKRWSRYSLA